MGREKLVGSWKLLSFVAEDIQTKERTNPYGEHPNGYIAFLPTDRIFVFFTADGRKPPQLPEDESAAFRSMIAASGKYHLEGDKFIAKLDLAWNEGWVGTDQVRFYKLEGDKLYIKTAPLPPTYPGGKTTRGFLILEKEK